MTVVTGRTRLRNRLERVRTLEQPLEGGIARVLEDGGEVYGSGVS